MNRRKLFWIIVSAFALIFLIATIISYRSLFQTTVFLTPEPIESLDSATLWQSRFFPRTFYQPRDAEYPVDAEGHPMVPIAQINFEEAPALSNFPRKGILQFFLEAHSDLYGWDGFSDDIDTSGYRIRYFPEVTKNPAKLVSDFSFVPDHRQKDVELPGGRDCIIHFRKGRDTNTSDNDSFYNWFGSFFVNASDWSRNHFWESLNKFNPNYLLPEHQIGGFANFVQSDPRGFAKNDEKWILLFQMDSDDKADILWGDSGIGNFFITPDALKKRDFSRVKYEYACF